MPYWNRIEIEKHDTEAALRPIRVIVREVRLSTVSVRRLWDVRRRHLIITSVRRLWDVRGRRPIITSVRRLWDVRRRRLIITSVDDVWPLRLYDVLGTSDDDVWSLRLFDVFGTSDYYGRTLSDASMLYLADVFFIFFYACLSWPNGWTDLHETFTRGRY